MSALSAPLPKNHPKLSTVSGKRCDFEISIHGGSVIDLFAMRAVVIIGMHYANMATA